MVPDGATLVIGGLMEDEDDYSIQGLPGLSQIPALGYLFGFRQKNEGRRELVVLLTPHIWSPDRMQSNCPNPNIGSPTSSDGKPGQIIAGDNSVSVVSAGMLAPRSGSPQPPGAAVGVQPTVALTSGSAAVPASRLIPPPRSPLITAQARTVPPGSQPNPAPAPASTQNKPQDSPPPRRRFFGSISDRFARRSDPQKPSQANPAAAKPASNVATDFNRSNGQSVRGPNPAIAPATAVVPARLLPPDQAGSAQ